MYRIWCVLSVFIAVRSVYCNQYDMVNVSIGKCLFFELESEENQKVCEGFGSGDVLELR